MTHDTMIRRARALTSSDWRLLIAASVVQVVTALALRMVPLPTVRTKGTRMRSIARRILRGSDERVIWAIEASGRRLAGVSTCLVRAIVVELALDSPQRRLRLSIGVRRAPGGNLLGHAWVGEGDRILMGGPADGYAPLVVWDSLFA